MPILNYTTKIQTEKTVGEIQAILAIAGAQSVSVDHDGGLPSVVTFLIPGQGVPVNFRLPSRWQGVWEVLKANPSIPKALRTKDQARWVAWRIVKVWVQAQMAIIEAGLAELAEVFLPYAMNPGTGQTLFQDFREQRLLGEGTDKR